eukprot:3968111-Pyramimonas_sp.AAC.1
MSDEPHHTPSTSHPVQTSLHLYAVVTLRRVSCSQVSCVCPDRTMHNRTESLQLAIGYSQCG